MSHTTTLTRDGIGRTTAVQNARGDTEHYAFDSDGNLTSVQNGRGKFRYYFYTARSELKQIQFADSTLETYKFDGNGNQTQRINGLSQTINYGYDTTDNLTSVTYPTGTPTTFTYDYDGRQSTMVDSTGTSSWSYDNADNVTQLVTPQGTMQYAYDAWNRRSSLTEGTAVTNYGYTNEKLTSITKSADSVSTTFSYDSYGRLVTKNDGATSTTYGYDGNDRVNDIAHANSSGTFHQEHYYYDKVNNLTSKVVNSVSTSYTYDNIDQLLTESQSSGYSYAYAYDANGNRTSKTYGINVDTYVYDDADKLTSMTKPNGTATYNYDNCGRLTSVSGLYTRSFSWNYEDQMASGTVYGTTPTNYTYNGVGTRVAKSGPFGNRTYKRDGVEITDSVLSDGLATMVPGISEKTTSGTSIIHTDRLGSMKAITSSGTVTDTAEYDAFGKVLTRTGSSLTQKGFAANTGYQEDGESGLKLLGHRYYDPETGRFISRDPIFAGGNWYAYTDNNPLKYLDPTGLEQIKLDVNSKDPKTKELTSQFLQKLREIGKYDKDMALMLWLHLLAGRIFVEDDLKKMKSVAETYSDSYNSDGSIDHFGYIKFFIGLFDGNNNKLTGYWKKVLGDDMDLAFQCVIAHEYGHLTDRTHDSTEGHGWQSAIDYMAKVIADLGSDAKDPAKKKRKKSAEYLWRMQGGKEKKK